MSPDAPDRAPIDPDAVAQHAFTKGRKGYDTDEVRAFLVGLASEIRDWQRVHADMERRLAEVERRAADPMELDEEAVTQLLGEETARVLGDARKAATEIRTKAEDESKAVRETADAEAKEARAAAEQYADSVRTLADEGEAKIRADAEAYATNLRITAERETTEQRTEADAYAKETRETADREVAEQRAAAQQEVEQLTQQAESVLAERTAEAEEAAAAVRTAAEEHDTTTRAAADEYAATTRSEADAYRDETRAGADAHRDERQAEADRIRADGEADGARLAAEAQDHYDTRVAEGEAEAARLVDDAREQGRAMVQEAREYRERVLADLADRRRAAREELERIGKTRDLLAVTLTDVGTQVERSHRTLQEVDIDPGSVSDGGADRRFLEVDPAAVGLAVGEVDDGAPAGAEDGDEGDEGDEGAEEDGDDGGSDEPVDADDDLDDEPPVWSDDEPTDETPVVDVTDDDEASDGDADEPGDSGDSGDEATDATEDDADEAGDADDGGVAEAADLTNEDDIDDLVAATSESDEPGTPPGIDDLFARIRAERASGSEATDAAPEPEAQAEAGEEPEAVERTDDEALLDRRDAVTDEIERQLARRLKRVLSDEQNEALHDLRSVKGTPTADEVLPSEDDHRARYRTALLEDLQSAERAGASFYGDAPGRVADVDDIADELSGDLVRQVRARLERSFEDTDDPEEVADAIRTLYREWKTQRIADAARHFVITAFARGIAESAPDDASFRWLVDHGGEAAPDCDDNALAGDVSKGEAFPTGDLCPPVHPGCRCLVVLVAD